MYMDKAWWGRTNEEWVRDYLKDGRYLNATSLVDNQLFFTAADSVTYPIAGSFVAFLVQKMGMQKFLEEIYYADNVELGCMEKSFQQWIIQTADSTENID